MLPGDLERMVVLARPNTSFGQFVAGMVKERPEDFLLYCNLTLGRTRLEELVKFHEQTLTMFKNYLKKCKIVDLEIRSQKE